MKTSETTEEDTDTSETAAEWDNQMEFSSDYLYNPSTQAVKKKYLRTWVSIVTAW
jgi:hypothetical protein